MVTTHTQTYKALSNYLSKRASLEELRSFVENYDWDDSRVPARERRIVLKVEAFLAGIDEDLNEESDIRGFLSENLDSLKLASVRSRSKT